MDPELQTEVHVPRCSGLMPEPDWGSIKVVEGVCRIPRLSDTIEEQLVKKPRASQLAWTVLLCRTLLHHSFESNQSRKEASSTEPEK